MSLKSKNPEYLIYYILIFVWLTLMPIFKANISHFGWGMIPLLLSILLIPGFIFFLLKVIINNVLDLSTQEKSTNIGILVISILIPFILIIACIGSFYYNFIR